MPVVRAAPVVQALASRPAAIVETTEGRSDVGGRLARPQRDDLAAAIVETTEGRSRRTSPRGKLFRESGR